MNLFALRFRRAAGFSLVLLGLCGAVWIVRASGRESLWSDPATWNGRLPRAGDAVTIPRGRSIVVDVTPPRLASLDIDGSLRFADRDLTLRVGNVRVRGLFEIGGSSGFRHRAEVVLDGATRGGGEIAVVAGGRLNLRGLPRTAWTTLDANAQAGRSTIVLARAVDWQPGDRIVVAPSGFAADEAEEAEVDRVDGARVVVRAPLRFRHWGTWTNGVDERAEVGLLSHTVVVRSEATSAARGLGGQVVVLAGGALTATDVEFRELGQAGRLGRYPIHFHEVGDGTGSSVVDSSIDHSFNRCLTIHGTNGVVVRGTVAYATFGHCYFLEDGVERNNVFEDDLGLAVRVPPPAQRILATDARPAVFWIANPDNVVRGDRAAGSEGYGFWYDLDVVPGGLARGTLGVRPRRTALGAFADDAAHTNEHDGLFVDNLRNPPGVREAPNYQPPVTADFERFTSYKNRRRGVWLRGVRLVLSDAHLADNAIGATFAAADATLLRGIVVGESENRTGPPKPFEPDFPIRGFEFYDGPVAVRDVRFLNFRPNAARAAAALGALEFSPFFMDPNHTIRGLVFSNALPLYFRRYSVSSADGYRSVAFRDLDGSVTGRLGATVVYDSPLLAAGCRRVPAWNAAICDGNIGSLFVVSKDAAHGGVGPIVIASADVATKKIQLAGNPSDVERRSSFQTNVVSGKAYTIRFAGNVPARVRVAVHGFSLGDVIGVALPQERDCAGPSSSVFAPSGPERHASAGTEFVCGARRSNIYVRSADVSP